MINYGYSCIRCGAALCKLGKFARRIQAEEYWYPLVVLNGEVAGDGNPKLKVIQQAIEKTGMRAIS